MLTAADMARRSMGLFFLLAACVMVIWGQTVLHSKLKEMSFVLYWSVCFLLLGAAIVTALVDIIIMQKRIRLQQEELIKRTLMEIELDRSDARDDRGNA